MAKTQNSRRSAGGFTLVEAVITLGILFIAVALVAPPLQNLIARSKLEGLARDLGSQLQRARLEAVTRSASTVVTFLDGSRFFAYADVNGDGIFNPDPGLLEGRTDYFLANLGLPNGVSLAGPESEPAVRGLSTLADAPTALFNSDGSIRAEGAFRLRDERDNFLEVAIEPQATARIVVRKWQDGVWISRSEGSRPWEWNH